MSSWGMIIYVVVAKKMHHGSHDYTSGVGASRSELRAHGPLESHGQTMRSHAELQEMASRVTVADGHTIYCQYYPEWGHIKG